MKTNLIILLLAAVVITEDPKCLDFCGPNVPNTYFCFDDKSITQNLCQRGCLPNNPSLAFVCKYNNPLEQRMCIYRCFSKSAEENSQFFLEGGCECPRFYEPVCGENNQVYFNDCIRQCNKEKLKMKGFCTSSEKWMAEMPEEVSNFVATCTDKGMIYPNPFLATFFSKIFKTEVQPCASKATTD